jgi:hypothetical protein
MTIKSDATTIKLCSPASVWKSHRPNSFKKAIEAIDNLIDNEDAGIALKAAMYTVDQHMGKPAQNVDLTTNGKDIQTPPAEIVFKVVK